MAESDVRARGYSRGREGRRNGSGRGSIPVAGLGVVVVEDDDVVDVLLPTGVEMAAMRRQGLQNLSQGSKLAKNRGQGQSEGRAADRTTSPPSSVPSSSSSILYTKCETSIGMESELNPPDPYTSSGSSSSSGSSNSSITPSDMENQMSQIYQSDVSASMVPSIETVVGYAQVRSGVSRGTRYDRVVGNRVVGRSGYSWLSGVNPSGEDTEDGETSAEGEGEELGVGEGGGEGEGERIIPEGQDGLCIVCFCKVSQSWKYSRILCSLILLITYCAITII